MAFRLQKYIVITKLLILENSGYSVTQDRMEKCREVSMDGKKQMNYL